MYNAACSELTDDVGDGIMTLLTIMGVHKSLVGSGVSNIV
jgi:hypothetical protein